MISFPTDPRFFAKNNDGFFSPEASMWLVTALQVITGDARDNILNIMDTGRLNLNGAVLSGFDLSNITACGATFVHANLHKAKLRMSILRNADMTEANLTLADCENASLRGLVATRADMSGANLTGAMLHRAKLGCVNLGVFMLKTDDAGSFSTPCSLDSADLTGAGLGGVDLMKCSLQDTFFEGAIVSGSTVFPPGFDMSRLQSVVAPG